MTCLARSQAWHLGFAGSGAAFSRACRVALDLAVSTDDGVTWRHLACVDNDSTRGTRMHYPTLQQVMAGPLRVRHALEHILPGTKQPALCAFQVGDLLFVIYSKFFLYRVSLFIGMESGRDSHAALCPLWATPTRVDKAYKCRIVRHMHRHP